MTEKLTLNRRSVVKGAAWSVRVVAATATVPAMAASQTCNNVNATMVAASAFHWGTVGAGKTRQQLQLFGRMQITGIAQDSVDKIKVEYVVQQRANGTTQPGAPTPTASGTDWVGTHTVSGTGMGMTSKGATAVVSNPVTGATSYFPPTGTNGTAAPIREYNAASTDGIKYTTYTVEADLSGFSSNYYTSDGSGDPCGYTFDTGTGDLGNLYALQNPIEINWQNQDALTMSNYQTAQTNGLHVVVRYTITLKNGQTFPTQEYQLPVQPGMQSGYFGSTFGQRG